MGLWTVRSALYKLGVFLQHLGFLLFLGGFSTPFWFYASPREGSQGLWQYCNGQCHKLEVEEDWFEVVRAVLCLSLVVYLVGCVFAVYDNCLTKYDPLSYKPSRRVEITTAVAGLSGATGVVVYTVMMKMQYQEYPRNYFGAAYGVTAGGCGLALLTAALLSATGSSLTQTTVVLLPSRGQTVAVTYQSTSFAPNSPSARSAVHSTSPPQPQAMFPAVQPTSPAPQAMFPAVANPYAIKQSPSAGYDRLYPVSGPAQRAAYPATPYPQPTGSVPHPALTTPYPQPAGWMDPAPSVPPPVPGSPYPHPTPTSPYPQPAGSVPPPAPGSQAQPSAPPAYSF